LREGPRENSIESEVLRVKNINQIFLPKMQFIDEIARRSFCETTVLSVRHLQNGVLPESVSDELALHLAPYSFAAVALFLKPSKTQSKKRSFWGSFGPFSGVF
jgi:hypothetical protein